MPGPVHHAMILCAGLGTRLRPLTAERPKPLVPLGTETPLQRIVAQLSLAKYSSAVINVHHLAEQFQSLAAGLVLPLTLSHEEQVLGTAGGVAHARALLGAPLVVFNGDILAEPPLMELAERVQSGGICLVVAPAATQGTVGLDARGNVVRLRGQLFGEEVAQADYVGVLGLGRDVLDSLPSVGCLIGDVCLPRLRAGLEVQTLTTAPGFIDVGSIRGYWQANLQWLAQHHNSLHQSFVATDADVAPGVELDQCLILSGARIEGSGLLRRCIVWPDAVLSAPARDSIVTSSGAVVTVS